MTICTSLADAYSSYGAYPLAVRYLEQCLIIGKGLRARENMTRAYSHLGELHLRYGERLRAIECFKFQLGAKMSERSIEQNNTAALAHVLSDDRSKLTGLLHLSQALLRDGCDIQGAMKLLARALKVCARSSIYQLFVSR